MNKNYLLIALAIFSALLSQAQSFTAAKDTVKFNGNITVGEINGRIYLQNASGATLKLRVTRVIESMPEAWETSFCTQSNCYPNIVDSADFDLSPNGQSYLLVHFYPKNTAGDGVVKLKVSDINAPEVSYELVYVGKIASSTVAVEEKTFKDFSLYPNPVKDLLTLELDYHEDITYYIFNSIGMAVNSGLISAGTSAVKIDVSNLDKGLYFLQLGEDKQQITRKIVKF
jgi:hypothetical protein